MSNKLPSYDLVFFSGFQSSILENKPSFSQSILTHKWSKNLKSSYLSYFFSHSSLLLLLDVILFSETFSENSTLAKDEWVFKWRTIIRLLVVRPGGWRVLYYVFDVWSVKNIIFVVIICLLSYLLDSTIRSPCTKIIFFQKLS